MGIFAKTREDVLLSLPIDSIEVSPYQPRVFFEESTLRSLAESIRRSGVLQPLTVEKKDGRYRLIAGERRLRAAKMAGLSRVPCLLREETEENAALLALTENLQREDLHYLEEAAAIGRYIRNFSLTQEEAAARLGLSQSAVANKLRLLRLSREVQRRLVDYSLSERHARALLRLTEEAERLSAVDHIARHALTVAESERYIEALLARTQQTPPRRRPTYLIRDVRFFLNSVEKGLRTMQEAGLSADMERQDGENDILLTIRIQKSAAKQ